MNTKKKETTQQITGSGSSSNEPSRMPESTKVLEDFGARVLEDMSKHNIHRLGSNEKPTVKAVVQGTGWGDARVEYHYEVGGGSIVGPGQSHQAVSILDFSKCSREDILRLACRPVVIALQRQFNVIAKSDLSRAVAPGMFACVDVKNDIVDASRKSAPPMAKASRLASKLSPEAKAILIAQLQDELASHPSQAGAPAK